jgi:hypothetical protein
MRLFIVVYEIYFSCALLFIFLISILKISAAMIADSNNQKIANATLLFKASNLNSIKNLI